MDVKEEIYQQIYHFIYNSLNTDGNVKLEKEEIESLVNQVWKKDYDQWSLYIRYDYLNEYYSRKAFWETEGGESKQLVSIVTRLYVLFFFIENLLMIWDKFDPGFKIYPNEKDRQKMAVTANNSKEAITHLLCWKTLKTMLWCVVVLKQDEHIRFVSICSI